MAYPCDIGTTAEGSRCNLVGKLQVFDPVHDNHILTLVPSGLKISYKGFLNGGVVLFTILCCVLVQQFPFPSFVMDEKTKVLDHEMPTWSSLHRVIELCSGMGALGHGALAMGFQTMVGNDFNPKMAELFSKVSSIPCVIGDICLPEVIHSVWEVAGGAHVITAGFSCQPFSALGDQKGQADARSSSLTSVLAAAFFLQCYILVLECVAPAGCNQWVQRELKHFQDVTGFVCNQIVLKLDEIWPCRRERWWCILSSPTIGSIPVDVWPVLPGIPSIDHLIPSIHLWAPSDEDALRLNQDEQNAFGILDGTYPKFLMNSKGVSPCALHAWGSQLSPCPCDCRSAGLSSHRLETKGLFGLLVRSAEYANGESRIRHVHPNEAMILNGVDPVLDYGTHVKLTLSAVGQLASPLQALWLFAAIATKLNQMQFSRDVQGSLAQLQALRSWLVMRSQIVWPRKVELISDENLSALVGFWQPYSHLSLDELMHSTCWHTLWDGPLSIGVILDFIIRQRTVPTKPLGSHAWREHPEPCDEDDDIPTPWMETLSCDAADDCVPVIDCAEGQVALVVPGESPLVFKASAGTNISDVRSAFMSLTGCDTSVFEVTLNGRLAAGDFAIQPGQTFVFRPHDRSEHVSIACDLWESGPLPKMPVELTQDGNAGTLPVAVEKVPPTVIDPVGPTAPWTQPNAAEPGQSGVTSPDAIVPEPNVTAPVPSHQSWMSAAPLLALHDAQFLSLPVPCVCNPMQLWSLRNQFVQSTDRLQILSNHGDYLADDEMRFHLVQLQRDAIQFRNEHHSNPRLVSLIDPLLASGWMRDDGPSCEQWANANRDISLGKADIITVFLVDGHWVPVYMSVVGTNLVMHTWDSPNSSHDRLNAVLMKLGAGFGFQNPVIDRQQRMFFTSELCGALAVAFLHHLLMGSMLPTVHAEAVGIHQNLRSHFVQALHGCNVSLRPWMWGAGDQAAPNVPTEHSQDENQDVQLQELVPSSRAAAGHECMTSDARVALISAHGDAIADDEVRFHLCEFLRMISAQVVVTFVMLEPLIFSVWDTIGHALCESWGRAHAYLRAIDFNVISMMCVDEHWIPVWIVPHGSVLQCHLVHDDCSLDAFVRPIFEVIAHGPGVCFTCCAFFPTMF